jgi:hypothetical protein
MDHKTRTIDILNKLCLPGGKFLDKAKNREDIAELFAVYNQIAKKPETGKQCGGCRARVLKNLYKYAVENYGYVK